MKIRKRTAAVLAAALLGGSLALVASNMAQAAAPTRILNDGGQNSVDTQWQESQMGVDGGAGRVFVATFLVEHAAGRKVTGVRMDNDFNGTDNASTAALLGAGSLNIQYLGSPGANQLETSRVTVTVDPGTPGGFGCTLFGNTTRRRDVPIRFRVQDDIGGQSTTVTGNLHVVEDSQGTLCADFPRVTGSSQSATEVTPGTNITFTFTCDDVDTDFLSSDDDCDKARPRWRNLGNGDVVTVPDITGIDDNTAKAVTLAAPTRGYWVFEAQLANEDGNFPDVGAPSSGWWRLGNAVVNDASAPTPNLVFTGANTSSTPPSINEGGPASTITAIVAPTDPNGAAQVLQWDADNNSVFERSFYSVPTKTGGNITHPAFSLANRTETVSIATPGVRNLQTRMIDNGAIDGADNIRRTGTTLHQLRVNAIPTASDVSTSTPEDTAVTVTMSADDPDDQPAPLEYLITVPPPAATGTLGSVSGNQVTFTPTLDFNGVVTFKYRVRDGNAGTPAATAFSNEATATITVDPVNDAPIANDQSLTTQEDQPLNIVLTASDVDNTAAQLTFTPSDPPNGSITGTSPNFTYTPDLNYNGPDSFTFTVDDGAGGTDVGQVDIDVTPVQDGPVAGDQNLNTNEDVPLPVTLTGSDVDGDTITFCCVTDPPNGSITGTAPNLVYTPDLNFNGTDSFDFTVDDGFGNTDVGTVTINVFPVNDAPVADDQAVETAEDTPLAIDLTGSDIDGDDLTFSVTGGPAHGSLAGVAPNFVYTPTLNYFGPDSFTFLVDDGNGGTDTGTVSITVTPVNDPPVANDQAVSTGEDSPKAIQLTASDVDNTQAQLNYTIDTPPVNGTLSGSPPNLVYTPGLNFQGTDQFTFIVDDGELNDSGTIDITVGARNDPPVADPQAVSTDEDTALGIILSGSDADGDTLTFSVTGGPSNGLLSGTAPNLTYTPNQDFVGHDSFTFQADDGFGGLDIATVDITVGGLNDPPVGDDQAVTTNEDDPIAIDLTASDVDGDSLTINVVSPPVNGTLTGSGAFVVYTPGLNYNGADTFTFLVDDGNGGTDTATVDITVVSVNDAPDAAPQIVNVPEDTPTAITLTGVDADGDPLTYGITSPPANGFLSGTAPNLVYTPNEDFTGNDFFTFSVADGNGGTDTATVSINVAGAPLIGTYIQPDGAVVDIHITLGPPIGVKAAILRLSSRLYDANNQPLAGKLLVFRAGGTAICGAVTDVNGRASCSDRVDAILALLNLGYQVNFAGDADYAPSSAAGKIIFTTVGP